MSEKITPCYNITKTTVTDNNNVLNPFYFVWIILKFDWIIYCTPNVTYYLLQTYTLSIKIKTVADKYLKYFRKPRAD